MTASGRIWPDFRYGTAAPGEYARHGVQLRPTFEVQHVGTMLGLIASGLGIGVLPQSLVQTLRLEGLAYRRFAAAGSYRSICSVTLLGYTPSPTVAAFIRHFRKHCAAGCQITVP